jgi:transcriptional regulator GlxA family with amidase domain
MIETGILITENQRLLSIAAILDWFDTVNKFYTTTGQPAPFNINLLSASDVEYSLKGYQSQSIKTAANKQLVLIPAFDTEDMQQTVMLNYPFLPWLTGQYQNGAEIATFCTGAFLLAATGLLNGKIATTHVDACNSFTLAFPAVKLKADKTVTEDDRLYTSGGATSTFHLLLHIVQKHCGKDTAIRAAKFFAIDMDRHQQSYFSTFMPSHNHNDELVASAQQKIEKGYNDAGTIEQIIKDIPASRRNIVRRFKQVTGITPIEYLQQTRIEAAKKLLEQTDKQMTEVIFNSGYNDPKAFRKIFRKAVGMTPSEYRDKFHVN